MIIRNGRDLSPDLAARGESSLSTSSRSISGSSHLGLALGISFGILVPLAIVVAIVWRWKSHNSREKRKASELSRKPSSKGSKEKSSHNTTISQTNPSVPATYQYPSPPHTAFGASRKGQTYDEYEGHGSNRSVGHSRNTSIDQATLISRQSVERNAGAARLAPREAQRSSADMGDLIEMLNSQRIDGSGKPATRKGRPFEDLLAEEEQEVPKSFLPNINPSTISLDKVNQPPRITSVPVVSPLEVTIQTPPPSAPTFDLPTQPITAIPEQPVSPKQKPKPLTVARGISATPAVYAPVTRSRANSLRLQNPIVPREQQPGGQPLSVTSNNPLEMQTAETLREARERGGTESEWY